MYNPDDWNETSCYKCPACGKFVSPEDGFYDREDRDDECSFVLPFCSEECADKFHSGEGVV